MIMITGWQVEIFYLGDFRNYVVDNLSKAQIRLKIEATFIAFSNQHVFFFMESLLLKLLHKQNISIKKGFCCVFS